MSKERELLSKASLYLEAYWNDEGADPEATVYRLFMEIDRFLGEPVQEPEPVAYINGTYGGRICIKLLNQSLVVPDGMALYTTPPDAAKRTQYTAQS